MDHYRAWRRLASFDGRRLVRAAVLEVESLWQLEIELDRGTLERAVKRVTDLDVDLGAVEGTVSRIELPLARVELVQRVLELL